MSRKIHQRLSSEKEQSKEPIVGIVTKHNVELIGPYKSLGEGSFGSVRRYETSRGPVAVKIARDLKDGISTSLLREAVALSSLGQHPNVIRLLDAYITPQEMAIIIPLADETLGNRMFELPDGFDAKTVKFIALQLIRGVAYIHSRDIIHGDLKVENVLMYEGEGCPKCEDERCPLRVLISDFGGAKTSRCFERQQTPGVGGSTFEVPPEVYFGKEYTKEGDIWALGCVIAQLLLNRPLFDYPSVSKSDFVESMVYDRQQQVLGTPPIDSIFPGFNPEKYHKKEEFILPEEAQGFRVYLGDEEDDYIEFLGDSARFVSRMITWNPDNRANALELLNDPWLDEARAMGAEPCLVPPKINSVDCEVVLLERQALGRVSFPYPVVARSLLYGILAHFQENNKSIDRTRSLAIYLFELCIGKVHNEEDITLEKATIFSAACYLLASKLLDPIPITAANITKLTAGRLKENDLLDAIRQFLPYTGLDLYVATSRDILLVLLDAGYSQRMADAALTLLELSYLTSASLLQNPEVVALACLQIASMFIGEKFIHTKRIIGDIKKKVDNVVDMFGEELSNSLQEYNDMEDVSVLLKHIQRGSYPITQILKNTKILMEHYRWLEPTTTDIILSKSRPSV